MTNAWSYKPQFQHVMNFFFFNFSFLNIGIPVRSHIDRLGSFFEKNWMWWSTSFVGGNCFDSWKISSNDSNSCCISGWTSCCVVFPKGYTQMENIELPHMSSFATAFKDATWMACSLVPCILWGWFCHWNSIVIFFELHTTIPSCFSHWTPSTKSNLVSGKEYSVMEKRIPWSRIFTCLNRPWHFNGLPLATLTLKGLVRTTDSYNKLVIFSLMKLWVEPLLISTTTSYCPILDDTLKVLEVVHHVKACKEISTLD